MLSFFFCLFSFSDRWENGQNQDVVDITTNAIKTPMDPENSWENRGNPQNEIKTTTQNVPQDWGLVGRGGGGGRGGEEGETRGRTYLRLYAP